MSLSSSSSPDVTLPLTDVTLPQIINAEVKAELARAITQLRHASHHYKHVKGEVERAIRARDKRVGDMSHAEGYLLLYSRYRS